MVHADRGDLTGADRSFRRSMEIAMRTRDQALHALCLVSLAELDVTRQRFEDARAGAEAALEIHDLLGNQRGKADAYRVIGMVYRETGRPALAESRLLSAIHLAVAAGATLVEAESCRELAIIHQAAGRNVEALRVLNRAHRQFKRLDAFRDAVRVGSRMADLEGTYLAVVREWGRSIETSDSRTYGHCERVAQHAVAMARALGLDEHAETTVLLGAYLHDVGMVRVPHEILSTNAPLGAGQRAMLRRHAMWGVELLAGVEFPWELKPIVRWHHERRDGSGYPDRLRGDEIPLGAQIVGILDAYDELLTGRFGRSPLTARDALDRILSEGERSWSARVVEVFRAVMSERS
jgi:putative nucleotidyltransferase with HDIG domain